MKFKKIAGMLVSLACFGVMTTSVSALAYDPCDVDHDGYVDTLDVISINKYLLGQYYLPNYKQMDANRNCVVDPSDATYIMEKIVGLNYNYYYVDRDDDDPSDITPVSFPDTGNSDSSTPYPNVDADKIGQRWYSWATYSGTSFVTDQTDYYIQPSTTALTQASEYEINAIVGNDDTRYWAIGDNTFGEITGIVDVNGATGFIVGNHEIVTCAHVVMENYQFKSSIIVKTCTSSGALSNTPLNVQQVHVRNACKSYHSTLNDYALIVVSNDLSGYTHFSIGESYNVTDIAWADVPIYVTGQPSNYNNNGTYFKSGKGNIYDNSNTSILYYTTDTDYGNSGSPVYVITARETNSATYYQYTALSVHGTRDIYHNPAWYNCGPVFTKYHRQFFLHNPKDPYINGTNPNSGTSTE